MSVRFGDSDFNVFNAGFACAVNISMSAHQKKPGFSLLSNLVQNLRWVQSGISSRDFLVWITHFAIDLKVEQCLRKRLIIHPSLL